MDTIMQDTLLFFDQHQTVYPLYEHFQKELFTRFPESRIKVQKPKSHITIGIFMPAYLS